jgi:hypothetical protein
MGHGGGREGPPARPPFELYPGSQVSPEMPRAPRPAAPIHGVVADAVFEYAELFDPSYARTR